MVSTPSNEKSIAEVSDERTRKILERALEGLKITREEALHLIQMRDAEDVLALFKAANEVRKTHFGNRVFAYGFIYFSTYCRNECTFCLYRKSNKNTVRYRKGVDEVLESARILEDSGVHLVDLTMGEDPLIHEGKRYDVLLSSARSLKEKIDLPLMVSPGVLPRSILVKLAELGVDWYALYQETYNRSLFSALRLNQDYDDRMNAKVLAMSEGMLVEEGILIGVGESDEDVIDSVFGMGKLGAHQVRAMGFIPQHGTPMEGWTSPPILDEMKAISLMRLLHQDRLIPASYDIDGAKGLELRLMAGANVVTSLIPAGFGLLGVAQSSLDVESNLRTIQGIKPSIAKLGLTIASITEYRRWVEREKELLKGRGEPLW